MYKIIFSFLALVLSSLVVAQETFPTNGVKNTFEPIQAFTNAHIIWAPGQTLSNANLLIQGDRILAVDSITTIPTHAIIHDMDGDYIYPSFIELYSEYGIPHKEKIKWKPQPQYQSSKSGAVSWNEAIHPEVEARNLFKHNRKSANNYRKAGFGAVLTHQQDGIARGSGLLTTLTNDSEHATVLNGNASAHYSFSKGSSRQKNPSSLMGSIALLNQTYLDAEWYEQAPKGEYNRSLEAWNELQDLPQFFEVDNKIDILRAWEIADEFEIDYIFFGAGDEYQRVDEIAETGFALVIPLDFPDAYDVSNPHAAAMVSLQKMKDWEMAPANARILNEEDIFFAFTSRYLKKKTDVLANIKTAIAHGLSQEDALAALTTNPAEMIEASADLGTLEQGKIANFLICSGNLFEEGEIYSNWIQGKEHIINRKNNFDARGNYLINEKDTLIINGSLAKHKAKIIKDSTAIKVKLNQEGQHFTLEYETEGVYRISATYTNGSLDGKLNLPNGEWTNWSAIFLSKEKNTESENENSSEEIGDLWFPNMAYGWTEKPSQDNLLFKNATVWTNEQEGILNDADVAISNGKILAVGHNLIGTEIFGKELFQEVDATEKHLTSGIIDEHSHIAIDRGVNEGSQASSAEVSIANVVKSNDINIYRQLSGGVTTAQLLHGSANPIGGQSGIIKFRWGSAPEEMKLEGAAGFIKFALGENVKQSNWGNFERIRFPQTRMGVEQVFYDHFHQARAYEQAWKEYNALSLSEKRRTVAPREDLEMNTLVEILNKERFITCHSYVQSEINMLMKVADSMGFTLNTFTHILEGYKVADKMKEHGAGGSTFSDWWAYKFEVNDAIPYNAALLQDMGVLTAINSDDAEMARRLNQEAAKAVKYGRTTEEEAWKMVTLNPAKLLHIDHLVGSIKVDKDADLVLWSDNPLSVYAKVEQTYVDGRCYFSQEKDQELRVRNQAERQRLIQKMLSEKDAGKPTQKVKPEHHILYHCDTMDENGHSHVQGCSH
ncbi:MAG: amidohydrolase [Flavobacteriales bacterium]|nr:amidohydrolase [Flavobacteriales bacterium]